MRRRRTGEMRGLRRRRGSAARGSLPRRSPGWRSRLTPVDRAQPRGDATVGGTSPVAGRGRSGSSPAAVPLTVPVERAITPFPATTGDRHPRRVGAPLHAIAFAPPPFGPSQAFDAAAKRRYHHRDLRRNRQIARAVSQARDGAHDARRRQHGSEARPVPQGADLDRRAPAAGAGEARLQCLGRTGARAQNLAAAAVVTLLGLATYYVMIELRATSRTMACIEAGHRNCNQPVIPGNGHR